MKKLLRLMVVIALFMILGCGGRDCPDHASEPSIESLENEVEAKCQILQVAVEEFASQNDGSYPVHVIEDSTNTGLTVIDLLPNGKRIINPFTGQPTEPIDRRAAYPGEIGYEAVMEDSSVVGYIITGVGAVADSIIVEFTN